MSRRICKYSKFKIQFKVFKMEYIVDKTIIEQDDIKHPISSTLKLNLWDSFLSIISSFFNILRTIFT